ncbi:hypothetical protein BS47DRAFT_1486818 [Hydnum rufescens UP504]|uniref:Uncharacterized protein n=1 Tax=Hydnum rufescens UP504 TaxID=1448309 RepID=A0A9P6ATB3_9AGAM|nr:hypothetical protein BS47DRAFT_1486818 [Hydnum rufescens UP504]
MSSPGYFVAHESKISQIELHRIPTVLPTSLHSFALTASPQYPSNHICSPTRGIVLVRMTSPICARTLNSPAPISLLKCCKASDARECAMAANCTISSVLSGDTDCEYSFNMNPMSNHNLLPTAKSLLRQNSPATPFGNATHSFIHLPSAFRSSTDAIIFRRTLSEWTHHFPYAAPPLLLSCAVIYDNLISAGNGVNVAGVPTVSLGVVQFGLGQNLERPIGPPRSIASKSHIIEIGPNLAITPRGNWDSGNATEMMNGLNIWREK